MSEWRKCSLGDVITLKRGYDLPNRERLAGKYPIVSSGGISGFHKEAMAKAPGVVTGRYGTIGEVFYITQDFWPLNTSLYVQNFKGNNPRFVSYFLKTLDLGSQNVAGAVPGVNRNALHTLLVRVPPFPIQKKIAAVLSAYDDLIENNDRRITLLEKMAEEIYREWFVRLRFPGHEQAIFHKGIPEGWEVVRVEELSQVVKRGISPNYDDLSNLLVINQRCIRDGNIDLSVARRHNTRVPKEKFIEYGDILINSTGVGTLGRISIVGFEPENITVDSHVTICRADERKISKQFLAHSVKRLQEYFELMAVGATGQVELSRALIINTQILVPPIEIQEKYSFISDKILIQKNFLSNTVSNLKQTRDRLLTRLISGKLSVEDLDIQFPPSMTEDWRPSKHE
jgi:type I restriction enzyme, S subunit